MDTLHIVHAITLKTMWSKKVDEKVTKTDFNNNSLSRSGRVCAFISLNKLWGHRLALIYDELATQTILLTLEFYLKVYITECVNYHRVHRLLLCFSVKWPKYIQRRLTHIYFVVVDYFGKLDLFRLLATHIYMYCCRRPNVLNINFLFHWISTSNRLVFFLFEE